MPKKFLWETSLPTCVFLCYYIINNLIVIALLSSPPPKYKRHCIDQVFFHSEACLQAVGISILSSLLCAKGGVSAMPRRKGCNMFIGCPTVIAVERSVTWQSHPFLLLKRSKITILQLPAEIRVFEHSCRLHDVVAVLASQSVYTSIQPTLLFALLAVVPNGGLPFFVGAEVPRKDV